LRLDRDDWEFINSFADWFAALGTVLAVVVSLRLARKQFAPNVQVHVSGVILADGVEAPESRFEVRAVNRGMVDVVVSGIHATYAFSRQRMVIVPPRDALSSRLPTRLSHGETAHYFFTYEQFSNALSGLNSFVPHWMLWPPFRRLVRVGVYTSTGADFMMKADRSLVQLIRSARNRTRDRSDE
jgi:hypothetical protein